MVQNKNRKYIIAFAVAVFAVMLFFFTRCAPATIFNTDDWCFLTDTRGAYPIWKALNPCRVLPEILAPVSTWLAMHFVYPLTKDIVGSISFESGLLLSISVTAYSLFAFSAVRKRFSLNLFNLILISVIFITFHFLAFRKWNIANIFAFHSISYTHVFFYTIPNIVNAMLVLYFISKDETKFNGIFILCIYLALLSNLYASIALPAFLAGDMLLDLINNKKGFFGRNIKKIAIIVFWAVVQIFELFGGRATSLASDASLSATIISNIGAFFTHLYHQINHMFLFFSLAVVVVGTILLITSRDIERKQLFAKLAIALVITFIYEMLVVSKAGALITYFGIFFEIFFFALAIVVFEFAYICERFPKIDYLLPVLCLIFIIECNTSTLTYIGACSVSRQSAKKLDEYLISSVIEADEKGEDYIYVKVPDFGGYDNFPLADYGGGYVSRLLLKYGIIGRSISVEFVPDSSMNEVFNLK